MTDQTNGAITDPFALTTEQGYFWARGNLHSHSTNSDGKPSPQARVDGYVKQGYDFLCVSDHYKITRLETLSAPDEFVLIQGAELHPANPFGGETHHFVCLNIHEDMDSKSMPPQHVIDNVNEQGGGVWLAHPYWSSVNILRDTAPLHGFAGIEVHNTTCRRHGRGDSSPLWDDWMNIDGRLYPALANDDSHALEESNHDTYESWTVARVKERTSAAIMEALLSGASYATCGPEIHGIQIVAGKDEKSGARATVKCSEARRIMAVHDRLGVEYHEHGKTFEEATIDLRPGTKLVRFEIIDPEGLKAWSNPFDLTTL